MEGFSLGDKKIPYTIEKEFIGTDLVGITYEQLLPYALPHENPEKAFQVISGNFRHYRRWHWDSSHCANFWTR